MPDVTDRQPFKCEVPGCEGITSREPHVCTKHFLEGWGRLPDMPLPEQTGIKLKAPLYVSDKDRKGGK